MQNISRTERLVWHRSPSFFLMLAAVVATAIGAANPFHGTYFEEFGLPCIFGAWLAGRLGW